MKYLKDKKLAGLLLFTFLVRLVVFLIFQPWNEAVIQKDIYIYDAVGYNILAKCIAFDFSFCNDTFRTPVYPAFVAVFYAIFGVKPWIVLLAQVILYVISAWLLFKISLRLFHRRSIAYIAVFLFALDPQQVVFTTYLYTDALFVCLFLWSMYIFIKAFQDSRLVLFIASGFLLGLTILTRPIAIYFPVILAGFILLKNTIGFLQRFKFAASFLILSYLVLIPWMYRNYHSFQHFALSSINGYNLLFYNAAYTEVNKNHKTYEQVCDEFVQMSKAAAPDSLKPLMPNNMEERLHGLTFEKSDVYNEVAKKYIKANFFATVKAHLSGSVKLHLNMGSEVILQRLHVPTKRWSDTEKYSGGIMTLAKRFFASKTTTEIMVGLLVLAFLFFVYITAFLGWLHLTFVQKQWLVSLFFLLLVGYFVFISGIFYTPRYRIPFMPFYMLLSGVFLTAVQARSTKKSH